MTEQIAENQQIEHSQLPQTQTLATAAKWSNKQVIAYLAEKFPRCFSVEGEAKPLKIGLFQDLAAALAGDQNVSKTQLRQYTANWRYLHAYRLGVQREPVGELTQQEVEYAQQKLAESKAKFAEKRQAEKDNRKKRKIPKFVQDKAPAKRDKTSVSRKAKTQPKLTELAIENVKIGDNVKVKISDSVKPALVLEIAKDSARVQLNNGVVINVSAENLFM